MSNVKDDKTEFEKKLEANAEAEAAAEAAAEEADDDEGVTLELDEDAEEAAAADEIAAELDEARTESENLRDQVLRARAEFDNFRKRKARDMEQIRKRAAEGLIADLLPVLDNLDLALQHSEDESNPLHEGVNMVVKQFKDVLMRQGLEPIDAEGEAFDPNLHEAVMQQESPDVPDQTVVKVFQPGYHLGSQVLRHAKVVVGTGGPPRAKAAEPVEEIAESEEEPAENE
jgi:molecular chaperone GrpE